MDKKNIYLFADGIIENLIPLLWFSSKTYFEEYGTTIDQWQWHEPNLIAKSNEDILAHLDKNPPHFVGMSVYVWNKTRCEILSQEIKNRWPNCLMVWGGPQVNIKHNPDFFNTNPYVDLVCPSDVYGEPIITHILDNFDNLKVQDIPEIYYQRAGVRFKSHIPFVKRTYTWPKNVYKAQEDWWTWGGTNSTAIYESTRGCPYKCSYCDWGGGTYTKVVKKPMETVKDELEFLAQKGTEYISVADANLGMFKERDLEIVNFIIDLKNKYGYPKILFIENAKNHLDVVSKIQRLLIKNELQSYYKIAIQNPHDEIKRNIERIDIPFEDQWKEYRKLKEEFDVPVLVETIIGLPGDSYQRTLDAIDIFHKYDLESFRANVWNLLPESPAYAPDQREKFKIKTKWIQIFTHPVRHKIGREIDQGVQSTGYDKNDTIFEEVIETYSYDRYEWCDMLTLTLIGGSAKTLGISMLGKYLKKQNIKASQLYDTILNKLIKPKTFNSEVLNDKLGNIPVALRKLVDDNSDHVNFELDIDDNFPMLLSPQIYFQFSVMLDPVSFYESIGNILKDQVADSEQLVDLCYYLGQVIIDINYNPETGREFQTKYNWHEYFYSNKPLMLSNTSYKITDKKIKFSGTTEFEESDYPLIDDYWEKVKQFFYHRGMNNARDKLAHNVITLKR